MEPTATASAELQPVSVSALKDQAVPTSVVEKNMAASNSGTAAAIEQPEPAAAGGDHIARTEIPVSASAEPTRETATGRERQAAAQAYNFPSFSPAREVKTQAAASAQQSFVNAEQVQVPQAPQPAIPTGQATAAPLAATATDVQPRQTPAAVGIQGTQQPATTLKPTTEILGNAPQAEAKIVLPSDSAPQPAAVLSTAPVAPATVSSDAEQTQPTPAVNGARQATTAPAARPVTTANDFQQAPVKENSFQPMLAKEPVSQTPAPDQSQAADEVAKTAIPDSPVQSGATTATPVAVQQQTPLTAVRTPAPATTGEQDPQQAQQQTQVTTQQADGGVQAGSVRNVSTPVGVQPQSAAAGAPQQAAATQKTAIDELSGTKTAPAVATAQFAPSRESNGQGGFGDADRKGHSEQDGQGAQHEPLLQATWSGILNQATSDAALPVEIKQASPQSTLHESVLAQIKDGVVTHDSNGTGQISIRLNPGELGELKIQVQVDATSRVNVQIHATNSDVKNLLMSNLDSLKDALASKNLNMDGFNVSTGGGSNSSGQLPDEKRSPQQPLPRVTKSAGYADDDEGKANYLTASVNSLLDVTF